MLYGRDGGGIETALTRFDSEGVEATPAEQEGVAQQYSAQRFRREMRDAVATAVERSRIDTSIATPPTHSDTDRSLAAPSPTDGDSDE
ncbi:hypothetical protein SAMN05216388_10506 [Halorientalis persicus]|uniref:Uncharacterized protein n=1 Tax=Halorientalis persicus TaxID=1367881 RepID=A0A1H8W6R0_9EURY|nr:hypothetical protein [Halorientalis persicus]SEP23300.1 hypothetical protein SAMN05216388_10506 [Halorientalis persicus]